MLYNNFLLIIIIVACASFIQGVVGFAFSLISVPLLSLLFSPVKAVGINSIIASINSFIIFYMVRKEVQYKKIVPYILIAFISIPIGIIFLKYLIKDVIMIALGFSIITLTLFSIIFANAKALEFFKSKYFGYISSFVSGFLGGAFTTPGPPMIAYFYNAEKIKIQAKANIQFYFSALDILIIPSFLYINIINKNVLFNSAILLPVVILFSKIGMTISKKLPSTYFTLIVNILLIILGLYILIRYL